MATMTIPTIENDEQAEQTFRTCREAAACVLNLLTDDGQMRAFARTGLGLQSAKEDARALHLMLCALERYWA